MPPNCIAKTAPEGLEIRKLDAWSQGGSAFFMPEAVAEYLRCFALPEPGTLRWGVGQAEILERIDKVSREENLEFLLTDVDSLLAESLTGTERVREIAQSLKSFARLDEAPDRRGVIADLPRTKALAT